MPTDFLDAHERQWQDAELLLDNQRWANADHLYGMAAECGLKRLMVAFGMPYDSSGGRPTEKKDIKHADQIWVRYEAYRSKHHQGSGYPLPNANPFSNWRAEQRYDHHTQFTDATARDHRAGVEEVRKLLKKAEREGLI